MAKRLFPLGDLTTSMLAHCTIISKKDFMQNLQQQKRDMTKCDLKIKVEYINKD